MPKRKEANEVDVIREQLKGIDRELKVIRDPWIKKMLGRERRDLREKLGWFTQTEPCSGSGYAHGAHGACPGYSKDRT